MNEKQNGSLPHGEETAEIELSAEQLLGFIRTSNSAGIEPPVRPQAGEVVASPAVAPQASGADSAASRALGRWKSAAAVTGIGSVLALAAAIGYEGLRTAPEPPPLPPPVAEVEPAPPPVEAPASDQPPVLVRNPFDKSEVFEFPAGTTTEEAKAAVADALLERARVRQAEYDAKHPKRRRSRPG
jgi:hypothetical protein